MQNKTEAEIVKQYVQAVANKNKADADLKDARDHVKAFMNMKNAEEIIDETNVVTMVKSYDYDKTGLKPLLEKIPTEDLILSGAYTPAGEKLIQVDEKWDIRILNKFKKRGQEVSDLLERIKYLKTYKFEITNRR